MLLCQNCHLDEARTNGRYCSDRCRDHAKYERAKARERVRLERRERAA